MNRYRDSREPRRRGFDDFSSRQDFPEGSDRGGRPPRPMPLSGPPQDATVKWFNPDKGFGFVALADGSGDAFLHIRAVEAAGHGELPPGARLVVRTAQGQKGPQVTEILEVDVSTAAPVEARSRGPLRPHAPAPRNYDPEGPATEMLGRVKWYDPKKGFGFIAVEDGRDVFVHRSALARAGLHDLQEGQDVTIRVVQGAKGREAASIALA